MVTKTVVRPAMLWGLVTVARGEKAGDRSWMTRMDRIRNENIRGTEHVERFGGKVKEARRTWFGGIVIIFWVEGS